MYLHWISITCLSTGVTNTYLEIRINPINPSNVIVECTFFQPGYIGTVDYGTDPSYTNLVYSDTSSTQGRMATIPLSQRLSEDTTYYYIVSVVPSESSSLRVGVQGRFRLSKYAYAFQKHRRFVHCVTPVFLSVYSPYNFAFMSISQGWYPALGYTSAYIENVHTCEVWPQNV